MDKTLAEIENIMTKSCIEHLPVLNNGVLVGIISNLDIKSYKSMKAGTVASDRKDDLTLELKAFQIMTRDVFTVTEETSLIDTIRIMIEKQIHCLPVLSKAGRVVGIVSSTDILRSYMVIAELFE
jgi:acetoin utilization protein AcuB